MAFGQMNAQQKGAASEMVAAAYLLGEGYEVFRNVCPTGPADLLAWKSGHPPILIDVKTVSEVSYPNGTVTYSIQRLKESQYENGIEPLYVFLDGSVSFLGEGRPLPQQSRRNKNTGACKVEGCCSPIHAKSRCVRHYDKWYRARKSQTS